MRCKPFYLLTAAVAVLALGAAPMTAAGQESDQQESTGARDAKAQSGWTPQAPRSLEAEIAAEDAIEVAEPCSGGMAGEYPCNNVDLVSFLPHSDIGGGNGNDIWGWTDPESGNEYALVGRTNGTAFVDISDPANPVYLGNLPTASNTATWRDIKVNNNHAYIVADTSSHGMQVFDLTRLRNVTNPPVTFDADARDTSFGNAHNIAIDEEADLAYVVGSNTCSGGPRIFDLSSPTAPTFIACASGDGYTHDAQGVIYSGPDANFQGSQIVVGSNEDTVTVYDVSDPANPTVVSRTGYNGSSYTHQGWFTEDHRYFLMNDELDESNFGHNTRTRVFDMSNLSAPQLIGSYDGPTGAIDHNLYVKGNVVYESNYTAGLRIIDLANIANPATLEEVGFFDVRPEDDATSFDGTWSNYPYFDSGLVVVNSIERGLFVLQPNVTAEPGAPSSSFSFDCNDDTRACDFDGTGSSDPDGSIASWEWDFGDGATGSGETASHTYAEAGTYTVTLTVTDDAGLTDTDAQDVTVGPPPANQPPAASFTENCFGFGFCLFDGTGSSDPDGSIASWEWDFGDGATGSGDSVFHGYGAAGTYTVTLTVTDDGGATHSVSKDVTVS